MKPVESYYRCEYCDEMFLDVSPPAKKDYKRGRIYIGQGTVLLPPEVVEKNHVKGLADSHAKDITGYFCDKDCLQAYLIDILRT